MSCNHRTYDKTNRDLKKLPRLLTSYQRARKDTNERIDFNELPEETPDYPIIRIFLHGDDSAVYAPRLIVIETNERKMTGFADTTDSCFVSSNAAVLQITHFAYLEESTTKRMSNIAIPKSAKKTNDWKRLKVALLAMKMKTTSTWVKQLFWSSQAGFYTIGNNFAEICSSSPQLESGQHSPRW